MKKIDIQWLFDSHECETCGASYAEGAKVEMEGVELLHLEPIAHCYSGKSYTESEVYREILEKLGYTTEEKYPEAE